jgi:hypothetical protein
MRRLKPASGLLKPVKEEKVILIFCFSEMLKCPEK